MKGLAILGSTGSVGTNVLRIVDAFPERFAVVGLSAGDNVEKLAEQVARYRPRVVSVKSAAAREALGRRLDLRALRVLVGEEGAVEVATHPDARLVVASAVGAVGLVPTYRALQAGKDVALANKETLVMAGELMVAQARARGGKLLPIDSEHCALHQCLDGRRPEEVRRLVLTASGGPFRTRARESFHRGKPAEAPDHERFPCLGLAYRALKGGGSLPAVLNAANEEAVAAFLDGRIGFPAIPEAIHEVMDDHPPRTVATLDDVLAADAWARERTRAALKRRAMETA